MEQRTPLTRKTSGWETRLFHALEAAIGRPFAWGEHDCATWAFDVAALICGCSSEADRWRGRYRTEIGAARLLRKHGVADMRDLACRLLGDPLPSALFAQRGDMVLAQGALGISIGGTARFCGPEGAREITLADCEAAWRV